MPIGKLSRQVVGASKGAIIGLFQQKGQIT